VADNEEEKASDVDIAPETKKILGLPRPLLIKVAIGLVVLLIAAGGYFFFMAEDPSPVEDPAVAETEVTETNNFFNPADKDSSTAKEDTADSTNSASTVMDYREQSMSFREENLQLRERIFQLESELTAFKSNTKQNATTNTNTAATATNTSLLHNYGDDSQAFPPIITDPPKPRPEPKWGEFDRAK
jgi:cytoskeletal protein RodZ